MLHMSGEIYSRLQATDFSYHSNFIHSQILPEIYYKEATEESYVSFELRLHI